MCFVRKIYLFHIYRCIYFGAKSFISVSVNICIIGEILALAIEKEVRIVPSRTRVKDSRSGRVYEYEYGSIELRVDREFVGRKAKVIVIIY